MDYGSYADGTPIPHPTTGKPVNRDDRGVRYSIVSVHDMADWALDEFEPVYSKYCPHCGDPLDEKFESPDPCPSCDTEIEDGEDWPEEVDSWVYDQDGLQMELNSDNTVWIFKSPVTTRGEHCSPCVPGAIYLRHPDEHSTDDYIGFGESTRCYGLPKEWWRG